MKGKITQTPLQIAPIEKSQKYLTNNHSYLKIHDLLSNCVPNQSQSLNPNNYDRLKSKVNESTLTKRFFKKFSKYYKRNYDYPTLFYQQNSNYYDDRHKKGIDPILELMTGIDGFKPTELALKENGFLIQKPKQNPEKPSKNSLLFPKLEDTESLIQQSDFGIKEKDVKYCNQVHDDNWKHIFKNDVVGLDAEFLGYLSNKEFSDYCCTVQIATQDKIFVFPLGNYSIYQKKRFFQYFMRQMNNPKILKLGMDFLGDFIKISDHCGYTEINQVWRHVIENYQDISNLYLQSLTKETNPNPKCSLNHICKVVLNKKLSKYDQLSYWLQNPLRKTHLHYAALDSYILLILYQYLK